MGKSAEVGLPLSGGNRPETSFIKGTEEATTQHEVRPHTPPSHRASARQLTQRSRCKRSLSLPRIPQTNPEDLSDAHRGIQVTDLECRVRMGDFQSEAFSLSPQEKTYGLKGLVGFLKNAWRKEKMREECHKLTSLSLSNEIEKSKLQISLLKSIVKSDESILADWARNVQTSKANIENLTNEKQKLQELREQLQSRLEAVEKELEDQKIELLNERNKGLLTRNEADALAEQLEKERLKIQKLKKEKRELMDKMKGLSNEMQSKDAEIAKLSQLKIELQAKFTEQSELLIEQCERQMESDKNMEKVKEELDNLSKFIIESKKIGLDFQKQHEKLKSALDMYKCHYDALEKNAHEQLLRVVEREVKKHYGNRGDSWKSALISVTNRVVGVPFYTFKTLVHPQT